MPPGCSLSRALCVAMLVFAVALPAHAGTLEVTVVDPEGAPVPDVAVYVTREGANGAVLSSSTTAVMDQRDTQFVPHILVVQKGSTVEFPNSDVVAHHVYSFSKPNNFVLPLYKGDPHDPVTFVHDGIVTLGCNIHDHMLAYIVVVDTDVFGLTDENGKLTVVVDDAVTDYTVGIWSPRIRDKGNALHQRASGGENFVFSLRKSLRPSHDEHESGIKWSEY